MSQKKELQLFRVCYHDEVFKNGPTSSIKKIKQFNKEMQLRLMYYRRNRYLQRTNISPILHLKANFNILHDYLTVLILYKAWEAHSKKLIKKVCIKQQNFTEADLDEQDSSEDQKAANNNYFDQDCNEFLNEEKEQQIVSDDNPKQEIKKHQITNCSEDLQSENIPTYRWKKNLEADQVFESALLSPDQSYRKMKL